MTRILIIAILATLSVTATIAIAQPDAAAAERLFKDGKRLMDEGNLPQACTAFEGSYRRGPAASTLLNLANCREKNHQYASAWGHFVEAARITRGNPDEATFNKTATERAATLEGKLSYLIINVPNDVQVEGLTITRNGAPVDPAEWNRDIPVDGGEYKIEGKAPGLEAWSATVKVGNAKDKQSVNVPRFREAVTHSLTPTPPTPARSGSGKRNAAVGLWVGGALALGAGIGLEVKSLSTYDDAKAASDNTRRHELTDSATQQRNLSIVAGGIGIVAVGAGVYLWFSGRPADQSIAITPVVTARTAAFAVVGTF